MVSSHSPSILARVDPTQVRHFRLNPLDRTARIRPISLPVGEEEASKFIREAVRTYPELYFARFVVLGEGASEEVVLPRLAEAMGLDIDRSFVAVVPLGRSPCEPPLATADGSRDPLRHLARSRLGPRWRRMGAYQDDLRSTARRTMSRLKPFSDNTSIRLGPGGKLGWPLTDCRRGHSGSHPTGDTGCVQFNVFFCTPLDLDYSMLKAFPRGLSGHRTRPPRPVARIGEPRTAVLGEDGQASPICGGPRRQPMRWYRYLFLGRGKPSTHVRVLSAQDSKRAGGSGRP